MTVRGILRSIIFWTTTVATTIWAASSVIFFKRIGVSNTFLKSIEYIWSKIVVRAGGLKIETEFASPLKKKESYIFISNHQSYLDIPVLVRVLRKFSPRFVAKSSLFNIPIFGAAMKAISHISIDRENQKKGLRDLKKAIERAKEGESILIFPEGTRNPSLEKLLPFHTGAFILAIRSGRPLVPVILHGTGEALPRNTIWLYSWKKRVIVKVLSPIETKGIDIKDRDKLKENLWKIMQKEFVETRDATG